MKKIIKTTFIALIGLSILAVLGCPAKKEDKSWLFLLLALVPGQTPADGGSSGGVVERVDIGAAVGAPALSGNKPSVAIDSTNSKLLVATENNGASGKLSIFRCNLDGSSCNHYDVSTLAGQGTNSGLSPALAVDNESGVLANRNIFIATKNSSVGTSRLSIYKCNPGMTSCSHVDVSSGVNNNGDEPALALYIDNVTYSNSRVIVASHYDVNELTDKHPLIVTKCALDLTGCISSLVSTNFKGYSPEIALDKANSKILIVSKENNGTTVLDRPLLIRCNLPLADDCITTKSNGIDLASAVSLGNNTGHFPVIAVDSTNSKLLVVTRNVANGERPSLFRCNLDGTGCTHTDLAAGAGRGNLAAGIKAGEKAWTDITLDTTGGRMLVVTHDKSNSGKPSLFRCNLDGSSCAWQDLSAGAGTDSGLNPSIIYDLVNKKLLTVTNDCSKNPEQTPTLFRN